MEQSIKRSAGHANTRSGAAAPLTPQACYVQDDRRILINLVGQLVEVQNYGGYYDVLCHIKTPGGISGDVCEMYGKAYRLKLGDLSKDQLIKVIGFLSTLEC